MSVTIRRVRDAAEAPTFADITLASFVSNNYLCALHPDGVTPKFLSKTIDRFTKAIEAPNAICILAETEEEPKETHWQCNMVSTQRALQKPAGKSCRILLTGKRFVKLFNMFVLPFYHRHGIGSKLPKEGMQMADERGLPMFLQGPPVGRPFNEKLGFEKVGDFEVDLSEYQAGAGMYNMTFLQREPCSAERPIWVG